KWRYARAVTWTNKGELDIAIADYDELIRLRESPAFYHVRGICYHVKGDYDRAIEDFNQAIRIDPGAARYYNSRSQSWYEKGEYLRAQGDGDNAIRLKPSLASAYANRGRALEAQEKFDDAARDYAKSIDADPNYALAYIYYAWLMATSDDEALRDSEKAVKYAERACKLTGWEDANALGTLAAACADAGDFEAAQRWETKAQGLYPAAAKERWAFLLELYQQGKPYRRGMERPAS
ncbi:MAG: tetratricopeptide repeat protein, partial [Planctomycetales bacterium]|nr:tetratricopeptide repeat protein [Planctomycetales bacterium]